MISLVLAWAIYSTSLKRIAAEEAAAGGWEGPHKGPGRTKQRHLEEETLAAVFGGLYSGGVLASPLTPTMIQAGASSWAIGGKGGELALPP